MAISPFSPWPTYFVIGAMLNLGVVAFFRTKDEPSRFGLPVDVASNSSPEPKVSSKLDTSSAKQKPESRFADSNYAVTSLIYLKGIRESSLGVSLALMQYLGHQDAVTAMIGVISGVALADGWLVYLRGDKNSAWKHWGGAVLFGGLTAWRAVARG